MVGRELPEAEVVKATGEGLSGTQFYRCLDQNAYRTCIQLECRVSVGHVILGEFWTLRADWHKLFCFC